jgi:hypothetical protein
MNTKILIVIVLGAAVAVAALSHSRAPSVTLHVPRVGEPIHIDAELEGKKVWEADRGHTGDLVDDHGQGIVPFTEVKARWGAGQLYLMLYAGDLDIETGDAFHLEIGGGGRTHLVEVSALGAVADAICDGERASSRTLAECDQGWRSHATVAVDRDGTVGQLGDNDEEWVVEMAIPLAALGLDHAAPGTSVSFAARRCDVGAGAHACGSWRGTLIFD